MRHKYATEAIVLGRTSHGEANAFITLLTKELGVLRARAQGVRRPGAKLAHALTTLSASDVILLRGKEGWRLSGAILAHNHFDGLTPSMRERAGRIGSLLTRLVSGEGSDPKLFELFEAYLHALPNISDEEGEDAEVLAALYMLALLGLDAGVLPAEEPFGKEALQYAHTNHKDLVVRVNRGIQASGL